MKHKSSYIKLLVLLPVVLAVGLWWGGIQTAAPSIAQVSSSPLPPLAQITELQPLDQREQLSNKYQGAVPMQWGEKVSGVAYRLDTQEKVLALTLDACGGSNPANGLDADLIKYLESMQIPAVIFVSDLWIEANQGDFARLASNPLFIMGNHGLNHRPCSISGRSAYNITGTRSVGGVIEEVHGNGLKMASVSGYQPVYYRSGTNFYDEVGVAIARDLGYETIGYSVAGDAGATFTRVQVKKTLLDARAGSIILLHCNHPEGQTAEGLSDALPLLLQDGFKFVRLSDFPLLTYP